MNSSRIIDLALSAAGGDEADVVYTTTDRNVSRFANSNLHQNMSEASSDLVVRVISEGRMGVAATTLLQADEIRKVAALAREIARRSDPLPGFQGLYRSAEAAPRCESFDGPTASLKPAEKARALRDVFDRGRGRGVLFAGVYTTTSGSIAVGNSHGVRREAPFTGADALLIALDGARSGFATQIDRRASRVDLMALADDATTRATLLRDSDLAELEPGEYDVILEPAALAEIFEWMNMITFSGRAYEDGSSFFVDQLGKRVVGENLTLADDPIDPDFLPFPFDMEGMPHRRVDLIDRGVARTPVLDKILSDRLGIPPTGNAAGLGSEDHGIALHLSMQAGTSTRDELIASTERGVWITRFHYLNGLLEPKTALMTGMTRDGTFLIEKGRVTRRLANLRWTQSMVDAFSNLDGVTRERRAVGTWWNLVGGTIAPTVKIRKWKVTGVQKW